MKHPCTIVTLTGYEDIFAQFRASAEKFEPDTNKIVVTSGEVKLAAMQGWAVVTGVEPFCFARNANLGIELAGDADVLLVNDDVQFIQPRSIAVLSEMAYRYPEIGILSPQVDGQVAGMFQKRQTLLQNVVNFTTQRLAFVCVYLKRSTIDKIGLLDEQFIGYGSDDDDYCCRVRNAGLKLAVTPVIVVKHGFGEFQGTSSFQRPHAWDPAKSGDAMRAVFAQKWGQRP